MIISNGLSPAEDCENPLYPVPPSHLFITPAWKRQQSKTCVCGRCYLAQLTAVMPGGEAPARDTPQHARMMELVSSFRQLLGAYLAEFTDTTMCVPNILAIASADVIVSDLLVASVFTFL